jgi:maleylpyruvate isomerase
MDDSSELELYSYFRSSASYRVRIALNLKGLPYRYVPVHLTRDGGEQYKTQFKARNPQGLVPVLDDHGIEISQSLAILEYLEEKYPQTPLLPSAIDDRAYVRQLALAIACEIHPLGNLRVLKFLTGPLGLSEEAKNNWIHHWITLGLSALEMESAASNKRGRFSFGDAPTFADCCLVPQLFNARRFEVDLTPYPTLVAIDAECQLMREFQAAHPSRQPDTE